MATKIRLINDCEFRTIDNQNFFIEKDSFILVSDEMAAYLTNDRLDSEGKVVRAKRAVPTGFFSMDNLTVPHDDYTFL